LPTSWESPFRPRRSCWPPAAWRPPGASFPALAPWGLHWRASCASVCSDFAIYSATGAFLWAGAWMAVGYGAGQAVERVVTRVGQVGAILAVALAAVIVGYVVLKWIGRRRFLRSLRIARVSPEDLKARLDTGENPLIVDLRTTLDVKAAPYAIPGAIRLAAEGLEHGTRELPRDRDVILYCS
jgi:hypothetical protein